MYSINIKNLILGSLALWLLVACSVTGPQFLEAVQKGDEALVKEYIDKGADVNTFIPPDLYHENPEEKCQIPLNCAANRGYYSIAKLLIEKGADVNALDKNGAPPLFTAIYGKKHRVVELLVQNNADVNFISNSPQNKIKHSPLTLAAYKNDFSSLKLLSEQDVNLDYQNFYGYSAISEAIKNQNLAAINHLVSKNADLSLVDKTMCNFLCQAAKVNDTVMVGKFIELGLPLENTDFQGNTPLMVALVKKNDKAAKYLIKKGADVSVKDDMGNTTIQVAAQSGLEEVVKLLVEAGADSRFKKQPASDSSAVDAKPRETAPQQKLPQGKGNTSPEKADQNPTTDSIPASDTTSVPQKQK